MTENKFDILKEYRHYEYIVEHYPEKMYIVCYESNSYTKSLFKNFKHMYNNKIMSPNINLQNYHYFSDNIKIVCIDK